MNDQARELRKMVKQMDLPRVIAVTSGKGGVGKTNITINLALALIQLDQRVAILDGDLGLANADVVLGMYPEYNLWHVLKGEKKLREIVMEGPKGLGIIAGGSGIYELANINQLGVKKIFSSLKQIDKLYDFILIDTGAGLHSSVVSILLTVDEILIIATPEPASIADAYGLIKTIVSHKQYPKITVLPNMVNSPKEGKLTWHKINVVTKQFLNFEVHYGGAIFRDPKVLKSVNDQQPFILTYPVSSASRSIAEVAKILLSTHSISYHGDFMGGDCDEFKA